MSKRYIIVGGSSFCIEFAALFAAKKILHFSPEVSVTIGFWVGFIVAFFLQKHVTYQNKHKSPHMIARQLILYSLLVLWNYLVTISAVYVLKNHVSVFIIRAGVIAVTTLWNFYIYKFIFKTQSL